jgi:putative DNA primase/helicase
MKAAELVAALGGKGGMAKCPAHDDRQASLSVSDGRKGVVVKCHAGCPQEAVIAALRAKGIDLGGERRARVQVRIAPQMGSSTMTTDDDSGDPRAVERRAMMASWHWHTIFRYGKPVKKSAAERYFRKRGIDCDLPNDWRCLPHGMELPANVWPQVDLPRLPALMVPVRSSLNRRITGYHVTRLRRDGSGKAAIETPRTSHGVVKGGVVEIGPTKGDRLLIGEGVETVLSCYQATGWRCWAALSAGNFAALAIPAEVVEVIVAGDNDRSGVGQKAAKELAERIANMGKTARLAIPERAGCDWNDVAGELSDREIGRLLLESPVIEAPRLRVISDVDFAALPMAPREMVLEPWLPAGGLAMIHAWRGVGKTHLALAIAYAVAHGTELFGWRAPKARRVLYVDGEMPQEDLQAWVREFRRGFADKRSAGIDLLPYGLQSGFMPNLSTVDGQELLDRHIADEVDLVIVDSVTTLCRSGVENDSESWSVVQEWLLRHRARGRSMILLHHDSKDGKQRGTSRREDVLDTVVHLTRPEDYSPEQGLRFRVDFTKTRHFAGAAAAPFVAVGMIDDHGVHWTRESPTASKRDIAAQLIAEGASHGEAARRIGVDRSTVTRWLAAGVRRGA